MYKKRMIITVMTAVCFIAACAHKPDSEEQVDIRDAVGDSGHQESWMARLPRPAVSLKLIPQNPRTILSTGRFLNSLMPALAQGLSKPFRQRMVHRSLSVQTSTWRG